MIRAIDGISNVSRILSSETCHKMTTRILIKDILILIPLMCCIPYNFFYVPYIFSYTCWCTFLGVIVLTSLYTNNVYVLNACFKYINDSLVKVMEILVNDEPHLLRRVYHMQNNPILLTKLRTLKQQHLEMSEVVQLLNNTCSMQIEAMFTIMFIYIIFTMYNYLYTMYREVGEVKSLTLILGFAIYYIVHIIVTVSIVEITRAQMQKTGRNVHRILVHTFDEQVTTELELFSLQVLQKGNAFVMKGLVIDATLLTKIACGITTFLLILVQFLLVESC
ncbi:uncharacterized protein LOC122574239 isoform X2 [Bombus pyrosoma]|uniref:uncharacterized protein LOC122574239 isoform X2 n=1 Tax=Bombus pyrosoma TaxID=396416 RepID=UPI001CB94D59|nr:uncharacterized protein LOC122574239 isoform X2 [Bombus pyrosoma]